MGNKWQRQWWPIWWWPSQKRWMGQEYLNTDDENWIPSELGKLENCTQLALDHQKQFLSDDKHDKLNSWYQSFREQAYKYDPLASNVTELSCALRATDANFPKHY